MRWLVPASLAIGSLASLPCSPDEPARDYGWPTPTPEMSPWAYWWWMGSAVDREGLTAEMEAYSAAGMGGLHIIPIYGAKGWEDRYVRYLTPEWMDLMGHAVSEARRVGMDCDMTLGTGWCFGGPWISDADANSLVRHSVHRLASGRPMEKRFDRTVHQAVVAYGPDGRIIDDLLDRVGPDGRIDWVVPEGEWTLYVVWQEPSGRDVKRAAPGGEGWMANPISRRSMESHLAAFSRAFDAHDGPLPRAVYHDSFEYENNWSPGFLREFERRRGYRLERCLPALFGEGQEDVAPRVLCDVRETISDLHIESYIEPWVAWAHRRGLRTRNQAHGSPTNLLDCYAAADIPETEQFHNDGDVFFSKLASSASHVAGHRLSASETCTWRNEHFSTTLGECRGTVNNLLVAGVNHVLFHGTVYSPESEPWPGWCFYASTQYNRRNSIWRDAPALNAYITRAQSVLQSGEPDNDVLLYWPIHEMWQSTGDIAMKLTVHSPWRDGKPAFEVAQDLWRLGYGYDYVSDKGLASALVRDGLIVTPGSRYKTVLVPPCALMPAETARQLRDLADAGATVLWMDMPDDVPGLGRLEERRVALRESLGGLHWVRECGAMRARVGAGSFVLGSDVGALLDAAKVKREPVVDHEGVCLLRRRHETGRHYFIVNFGENALDAGVPLGTPARSVEIMDPMTGKVGAARMDRDERGRPLVRLQVLPGETLLLRTFEDRDSLPLEPWPYTTAVGAPSVVVGPWSVEFVEGGPGLPEPFAADGPVLWTERGDAEADRFAGTARYSGRFDAPEGAGRYALDLGEVRDSCRVTLNGERLGTLLGPGFALPAVHLTAEGNALEVEVTNVAANRIRDMDIRGVEWKKFHDINFVNLNYRPFDASGWPVRPAGLLGPVTLTKVEVG